MKLLIGDTFAERTSLDESLRKGRNTMKLLIGDTESLWMTINSTRGQRWSIGLHWWIDQTEPLSWLRNRDLTRFESETKSTMSYLERPKRLVSSRYVRNHVSCKTNPRNHDKLNGAQTRRCGPIPNIRWENFGVEALREYNTLKATLDFNLSDQTLFDL